MITLFKNSKNIFIGCAIISLLIGILFVTQQRVTCQYTIGIIQTASHPALDAARDGFMHYVKEKCGEKVSFIIKNAQGSTSQAHLIAQYFHGNNALAGIFAIGTLAAQSALQANKKPLFVAAVTDPAVIGLTNPSALSCGASDMINAQKQVELLRALVPNAKTVTLFYNIGESNALNTAQQLESALRDAHYQVSTVTVTQQSEVPLAIDRALQSGDVIMTPIDNTVASTITFIAQKALNANKPLIVSDNLLVKQGALAAAGIDYYALGRKTGECAIAVLKNKKNPSDLGFSPAPITRFAINKKNMEKLGLDTTKLSSDQFEFVT